MRRMTAARQKVLIGVLAKLITSPGAAYFSTKKHRNVKEPLVSSHTISV
jgi:hypothetical protein